MLQSSVLFFFIAVLIFALETDIQAKSSLAAPTIASVGLFLTIILVVIWNFSADGVPWSERRNILLNRIPLWRRLTRSRKSDGRNGVPKLVESGLHNGLLSTQRRSSSNPLGTSQP